MTNNLPIHWATRLDNSLNDVIEVEFDDIEDACDCYCDECDTGEFPMFV